MSSRAAETRRPEPPPVGIPGTLREVAETLAPIERPPCSDGERQAAEWLVRRLRAAGVGEVELEQERGWGTFPPTVTALAVLGSAGAGLVLAGRRLLGGLAGGVALAGFVDEIENGPRILRRGLRRRRTVSNVVARIGEADAERTLVVLAHHDAPQTGAIFDQTLQRKLFEWMPNFMDRFRTSVPHWWGALAGPLSTIAAAASGYRRAARAGLFFGLVTTGLLADIWRSPTVPGANDNLSGVAGLVALAELWREEPPPPGLRVMLVSCGSEESLQDGIRGFMSSHAGELPPGRTWVVNLETIGSPQLTVLEAEGPIWMRPYTDPSFRDLFSDCARAAGISLTRELRSRSSTDSVIPSRAGYPTATVSSVTFWRGLANYHWPTDVPENLDYDTIESGVRLTHAVAERLGTER